ncbi:MAG: hypothetical protein IKN81_11330 [Oscillospiraceae bacterium]|nr:hypothetical protein [Oscillospiraceae bacterium]
MKGSLFRGEEMFGMVCEHTAEEPRLRVVEGVRFCAVYVTGGNTLRARLSCRAAARALARQGVREAVFLSPRIDREPFARRGIAPIAAAPLHRAAAASIVRKALAERGLDPRHATVAFVAERVTPELCCAVKRLSADVRYLVLRVPDGAALAKRMQRECGVAIRQWGDVPPRIDLIAAFDGAEAAGTILRLDDALCVAYNSGYSNELLAALWRAGALDAERLEVLSAGTTEENSCKTPR